MQCARLNSPIYHYDLNTSTFVGLVVFEQEGYLLLNYYLAVLCTQINELTCELSNTIDNV